MTNPVRGEHTFEVEGIGPVTLRMSMGALARIEAGMNCSTMQQLFQRLTNMGVSDMILVLHSLAVAGGKEDLTIKDVENWPPLFTLYSGAIQQTLIKGGFIADPAKGTKPSPKEKSQ